MNIRLAQWEDTETICYLLKQMGYSQPLKVVQEQFQILSKDPNAITLVAADDLKVYGVLSLYFIPQIALQGDFEPYRVCRRVNILRDYPDDKTKLYPRN